MSDFNIYCTSEFLKQAEHLHKQHKHYGTIFKDLYTFLNSQNKNTIFNQQEFIVNSPPDFRIIKYRLAISLSNKSERGGFRLYYNVLNRDNQTNVCLMYVYSKTGCYATNNVSSSFIKGQTKVFASEKRDGKLIKVNLNSELCIIDFN